MDVLLECRVACRLGLPDIDVTQTAVFAAHAHVPQVRALARRLILNDAGVDRIGDGDVLGEGVHGEPLLFIRMFFGSIAKLVRMEPAVKRRAYSSPRRAQAARQTKAAILAASRPLFISQGYAGTTVAAIAEDAGVAVDTVYASVGRKPQVFRLPRVSPVRDGRGGPALERDYVKQIEATSDAVVKLAVYAEAVTSIQGRLAPLFVVVRQAAATEPELAALWTSIAERRLTNMRLFAASLQRTGQLRPELSIEKVADIVWSMNSPTTTSCWSRERAGSHRTSRHGCWRPGSACY